MSVTSHTIHAFRPEALTTAIAHVTRAHSTHRDIDAHLIEQFHTYAATARERGFTATATAWMDLANGVIPSDVTADLLDDWVRHGLSKEQAWQAMWLT